MDAIIGWVESLGYSINNWAFGPPTILSSRWLTAGTAMHARVICQIIWFIIAKCHCCYFSSCLFVLDKRNTLWLCDMVRQTSLRKSAAGAADFPQDVYLTVARNHTQFKAYIVKFDIDFYFQVEKKYKQKWVHTMVPDGTKPLPKPMLTYHQ